MDKEKFIKYCAEVMGYRLTAVYERDDNGEKTNEILWFFVAGIGIYEPYDDLNQMAEVFDKVWKLTTGKGDCMNWFMMCHDGIKQAMRDFIVSTKGE